jgi:hypothetical protein
VYIQNDDYHMREIMHLAHEFLQHFCRGNSTNQIQIHRHIDLFFQSGDSVRREGGREGGKVGEEGVCVRELKRRG